MAAELDAEYSHGNYLIGKLTNLAARILRLARLQLSIVPTCRALEGCLPAHRVI